MQIACWMLRMNIEIFTALCHECKEKKNLGAKLTKERKKLQHGFLV